MLLVRPRPRRADGRRQGPLSDVLITLDRLPGTNLLATGVVVFEVLSPESGRRDRIEKVRDYASVGSILRYVIVESASAALTVLHRGRAEEPFSVLPLTAEGVLPLPEIGTELPVAELYEDVAFEPADPMTPSRRDRPPDQDAAPPLSRR